MQKESIEIKREKGFATQTPRLPMGDALVMESLLKWSVEGQNRTKKIYRHLLREEIENLDYDKMYFGDELFPHGIPTCDIVIYLDIYWQ